MITIKNKKNLILLAIFVLIIIGIGIFWWQKKQREGEFFVRFEPPENYIIKETPEGKIVENKKAGLNFKVPEGWKVEVLGPYGGEGIVEMASSDTDIPSNRLPTKGCGAMVSIEYRLYENVTQSLLNLIKEVQMDPEAGAKEYKEIIEVASYPALKRMTFSKAEIGRGFLIEVPTADNKVYVFSTFFPSQEERCSQEFNKFLEGVSIKNK